MQSYKDGRLFKAQFNWKMPDLFGLLRSAFAATSIQRQTAAYGEQLPIPGGLLSDVYTRKRTGSFPPQAVLPLPTQPSRRKRCRRSPEADVRQPSGNTSLGWISAGPLPGDDARKRTFSARPGAKPGAQAPLHNRAIYSVRAPVALKTARLCAALRPYAGSRAKRAACCAVAPPDLVPIRRSEARSVPEGRRHPHKRGGSSGAPSSAARTGRAARSAHPAGSRPDQTSRTRSPCTA